MTARPMPWEPLARSLNGKATTAAQAAKTAGLDFDVLMVESAFKSPVTNRWVSPKDRRAVVRVDGTDVTFYEYVSDDYTSLQYGKAFSFLDEIQDVEYIAAGDFAEGRQGFVVVRIPGFTTCHVGAETDDVYLIVRSSHNKSRGLECSVLLHRPKTGIALTFAGTKEVPQRWSSRHIGADPASRLANAAETIRKTGAYLDHVGLLADRLHKTDLFTEDAENILEAVLPDKARRGRQIDRIICLWEDEEQTALGLVHATVRFLMWERADGLRTDRSRFTDVLTGTTHTTLNRVASRALSGGV